MTHAKVGDVIEVVYGRLKGAVGEVERISPDPDRPGELDYGFREGGPDGRLRWVKAARTIVVEEGQG